MCDLLASCDTSEEEYNIIVDEVRSRGRLRVGEADEGRWQRWRRKERQIRRRWEYYRRGEKRRESRFDSLVGREVHDDGDGGTCHCQGQRGREVKTRSG